MNTRSSLLFVVLLVIALVNCSSDDTTTGGGPPDTTPPAVTSVTPVDQGHIDVVFSETVRRDGAERPENYRIVEVVTPLAGDALAAPGDTLRVGVASLGSDNRTVTLSLFDLMDTVNYEMKITGVSDASGNTITSPVTRAFTGTSEADMTPPTLVYRSPTPNATGVGVAQPVIFRFSEPVDYPSVASGVTWTVAGGGAAVPFQLESEGPTEFALSPQATLAKNTQYTVTLTGVMDFSANTMPVTSWTYTTTPNTDTTPPTVVSSVPANNATNVSVNANLSITFSEAINQVTFRAQLSPDVGEGTATWSNGGKTVTFDPVAPLATNRQYTLTILPGDMADLAGNKNVQLVNIVFSTGSTLASGGFSGTIAGDPGTGAADPTGAIVAAADAQVFATDDFNILGNDVVAGNDTYNIRHLPDDVYYPLAIKNTNGDNELDPSTGDAIGLYGVDIRMGDMDPDSVTVSGGNQVPGVNFPLYDISAIAGTVSYEGTYAGGFYNLFVGVFDTVGFDPTQPPDYGTTANWPYDTRFSVNGLDDGLADGSYYVGAYMDVNTNAQYDPGTDPAGFYNGIIPTAITIANGSDAIGLVIVLEDPVTPTSRATAGVSWPKPAHRAPWLKKLSAAIRQGVPAAK